MIIPRNGTVLVEVFVFTRLFSYARGVTNPHTSKNVTPSALRDQPGSSLSTSVAYSAVKSDTFSRLFLRIDNYHDNS
ncbi:hypothetical protein AWB67_05729 [Caballeronia terrestris]|uniref:Uncharacterized protein n=1 Tax=Caballeronia terrestris TaxID=1226301 RepID=A0A158KJQ4_9BURK|nr:hypothetical protein AWB67_05729 [Caballeronia terrestris]